MQINFNGPSDLHVMALILQEVFPKVHGASWAGIWPAGGPNPEAIEGVLDALRTPMPDPAPADGSPATPIIAAVAAPSAPDNWEEPVHKARRITAEERAAEILSTHGVSASGAAALDVQIDRNLSATFVPSFELFGAHRWLCPFHCAVSECADGCSLIGPHSDHFCSTHQLTVWGPREGLFDC